MREIKRLKWLFLGVLLILNFTTVSNSSTETFVSVEPSKVIDETLQSGSTFTVNLTITDVTDLYGWQVNMSWEPSLLNISSITPGDFLKGNPSEKFESHPYDHDMEPYAEYLQNASTSTGEWNNPEGAYTDGDRSYAYSNTSGAEEIYGGYDFPTTSITSVKKLEVGIDLKTESDVASEELDDVELQVTNDGGSTWGPIHFVRASTGWALIWVDVTDDFPWTPDMLSNTNFKVKIRYKQRGENASYIFIDWLPARAYDMLVANPVPAYDKNLDSYTSFGYGEADGHFTLWKFVDFPSGVTDPVDETSKILQVDFHMKFSANASTVAPKDKYRIVYYVPVFVFEPVVLLDWTSSETPLAIYNWTNQPEPNEGVWDWFYVSEIRFAVETDKGAGDPNAFFYEYEAWITVTYEKPTTFDKYINEAEGWALLAEAIEGNYPGTSGSGVLATVTFLVENYGNTELDITDPNTYLVDSLSKEIPFTPQNGYFSNKIPGDVDGDKDVDRDDFFAFLDAYGSVPGDPNWDPDCDFDWDGDVDRDDFFIFLDNYGRTL